MSKSKKITIKPAGISVSYVDCESCPDIRPGMTPLLVKPESQCAHCYGILWARANPVKPYVKKKMKKSKRKKVAVK